MYLCKSYTTASVKFSNEEYATPALHAGVHFFFFLLKRMCHGRNGFRPVCLFHVCQFILA